MIHSLVATLPSYAEEGSALSDSYPFGEASFEKHLNESQLGETQLGENQLRPEPHLRLLPTLDFSAVEDQHESNQPPPPAAEEDLHAELKQDSPADIPNSLETNSIDSGRFSGSLDEFWLSKPYESGVTNRLLTEYFGRFDLSNTLSVSLGTSLSFLNQWGLSLAGISGTWKIHALLSELTLGFQQERWPSWNISENRAVATWGFSPFPSVTVTLGYGYRSPQYKASFLNSFNWPDTMGELGLIYRLEFDVLRFQKCKITFLVFDYDRMRLSTYTNIHFSLQPQYALSPEWKLQALLGLAAEGVSGGVVSWNQSFINIGLSYHGH